jgi:hypothetical protein
MKMIAIIALALLSACVGLRHYDQKSTEELQLLRYQMMRRLAGQHLSSGRIGDDGGLSGEQRQLEAIEQELTRRGAIDYSSAPHVTYW